jgi:large subunit ribosomal protein L30
MAKKLKIQQIRSIIGCLENQKATIRALGLKKINKIVIQDDNSVIRGMVNTVKHLVKVEEVEGE